MPASSRRPIHTRSIRVEAYARDDGLWDIEASLVDTKPYDFRLASGVRPAGQPVHQMRLAVTVDADFNIVAAGVGHDAVPYPGYCDDFGEVYQRLAGLNLLRNFRREVRERLGGVQGCTHLTELAGLLPTATFQAFAGTVYQPNDPEHGAGGTAGQAARESKPAQLDRCRALRTDGPAVARFYPRWVSGADYPTKEGSR